jgi:hypothetical protein
MTAISPGATRRMLLCLLIAFTEAGNTRNESRVDADYTQCTTQARYTNGRGIETGRLGGGAKDGDGEGLARMPVWPALEGHQALVTPRACTQESGCNLQIKGPHSRIPVSHPSSPIFTAQLAPSHNALIPQTDSSQLVSGLPYVAITNSPSPRAKLLWALRSSSKAQPQSQVPLFFSQTQGVICSSRGYLLILYHHY